MRNTAKVMTLAAVMVIGTAAFAGPRGHHHHRDGLGLAFGIVNLVIRAVTPQPVVYVPAAPPAPVILPPPAPVVLPPVSVFSPSPPEAAESSALSVPGR